MQTVCHFVIHDYNVAQQLIKHLHHLAFFARCQSIFRKPVLVHGTQAMEEHIHCLYIQNRKYHHNTDNDAYLKKILYLI